MNPGTTGPPGRVNESLPPTTSRMPALIPAGPSVPYSTGLMGPRSALFSWVASASTPASSGEASEVPSVPSMVMSGTERHGEPVIEATPSW